MATSLSQPEGTYLATYRGSTIILAHANKRVSQPVAHRMAKDIDWMRTGDITIRVHTLYSSARRDLMRHIPSEVFAKEDSNNPQKDISAMIKRMTEAEQGAIEELIVLSKMPGFRTDKGVIMPLLSDTKIAERKEKFPQQQNLLSAVEEGLKKTPKIVFTLPQFLGDEIRSVTGKGTMCFNRAATTYSPLLAREVPIFMENYHRNAADGTFRARDTAELEKICHAHYGIRAGRSIIAGFSLTPQDKRRLSLELVWGASRGGDLGSLILDHATKEAASSSYYAMTVRDAVAHVFASYSGIESCGRVSDLLQNGKIETYAPEHADYDTAKRDPHFFWHQGRTS